MDFTLYSSTLRDGAWVNLTDRGKWTLSGTDRVRYLNGQVTQDVRLANAESALHACVTNAKGRMEGDVFLHSTAECLWLDAAPGLRETLGLRLERYIIADDAVLEDVSGAWQLWHWIGGDHKASAEPAVELGEGGRRLKAQRFGRPGYDIWLPAGHALEPTSRTLIAEQAEAFRILQQVPAWPTEIHAEAFPQEAGLEKSCMSFTKGCYIGQEVLSRIKTTGRMPRELIAWEQIVPANQLPPEGKLFLEEREIGQITSAVLHPETKRWVGLAYVRQGMAASDSVLRLGDALPSVSSQIIISAFLNQ
jgi:folate-binding protein YgfZ